jgi:hypothetical protein
MGTWMSGREPCRYTRLEAGKQRWPVGAEAEFEEDMVLLVLRPASEGSQVPALGASGSCFPYGGVKRIRFEDFRSGSCFNLSPEPRTRLNEVKDTKDAIARIFQP